eukprot:s269_g16.t1
MHREDCIIAATIATGENARLVQKALVKSEAIGCDTNALDALIAAAGVNPGPLGPVKTEIQKKTLQPSSKAQAVKVEPVKAEPVKAEEDDDDTEEEDDPLMGAALAARVKEEMD